MSRDHIPLRVQLAAALCQIGGIPYEHAKGMTPEQVRSLFALDHYPVRRENGKTDADKKALDVHYNLMFRFTGEHRVKTATIDHPEIAKSKRLTPAHEDFQRRLLAKAGQCEAPEKPRSKWGNRPMQSRNNLRKSGRF